MSDEKKSGGKIFLTVLGFLVLAGGIALITLGIVFAYPDLDIFKLPNEIYYAVAGIAGLFIATIFLIIGFRRKFDSAKIKEKEIEKLVSRTDVPTGTFKKTSEEKKAEKIAEKAAARAESRGDVICYKCGTENNSTNYYCTNCKSSLLKVCPFCGHGNNPSNTICEGCERVF